MGSCYPTRVVATPTLNCTGFTLATPNDGPLLKIFHGITAILLGPVKPSAVASPRTKTGTRSFGPTDMPTTLRPRNMSARPRLDTNLPPSKKNPGTTPKLMINVKPLDSVQITRLDRFQQTRPSTRVALLSQKYRLTIAFFKTGPFSLSAPLAHRH